MEHLYENVLVIGATGFLGGKLTRALMDAGENVSILVKSTSLEKPLVLEFEKMGAKVVIGDVNDPTTLDNLKSFEAIVMACGSGVKTHKPVVEACVGGKLKRLKIDC